MVKKITILTLSAIFILGVILPASAAPTGALAQVIEGAKKEGTVSVKLVPGFSQKSMVR
jgi:hypothetical protein